jgi:hypothetical protein
MNPYSVNFFRLIYILYIVLIETVAKLRIEGALVAASEAVFDENHIHDVECFEECVWLEITMADGRNLLIWQSFLS